MKNQNDLIFSIVSIVIGIVLVIVFFATSPTVQQPAAPTPVDTAPPQLPKGDVVFANSLPGGNSQGGAFGAGMPGARMGGGRMPMGAAGAMGGAPVAGGTFGGRQLPRAMMGGGPGK